jgi:hypothetical protein
MDDGRSRDYGDIPDSRKIVSPDGTKALAWYVYRHNEDAYDDDTYWEIKVWDTRTGQEIASWMKLHAVSSATGSERGKPVASCRFASHDAGIIIGYQDGSEEMERYSDDDDDEDDDSPT